MKVPRWPWFARRKPSLRRLAAWAAAALLSAQALTIGALQVVSIIRRRREQEQVPPADPAFEPVRLDANTVQLFSQGQQLYDAMLAAIDAATESVYLETFIWKGDRIGQRFKDAVIRKAREGVDVYVIYDHFGNLVVPAAFKRFPGEVHVLAYRAMTKPWHPLDPRHYALEHRKVLVVDGRTAFLGGYNIGDLYATEWRDTHIRIDGPGAASLAQLFTAFWNDHAGQRDKLTRRYRRGFDPVVRLQGNNAAQLTFPIRDMYIDAIDAAEECIRLTSAYFVPDQVFVRALLRARERGAEVKILVPWTSNHVVADWVARGYFEELLRGGVRLFGYRSMLHAKTCTIDGQWSTVGTANIDRLSAVGNYEANVEVYSRELARQMEELFERDLAHAREIRWQDWRRRPWYARLGEDILKPLKAVT